jgi:hypothetical protein
MNQGPTREAVFQALYALFYRNITGVATYSRRTSLPAKIGAQQLLPGTAIFFQVELPYEKTTRDGPMPIKKREWHAGALVYFQNLEKSIAGMTIANPLIDAIEALLEPPAGQYTQQLGGLVEGCWIEGETLKESGDTDENGLGFVWVPLTILVP